MTRRWGAWLGVALAACLAEAAWAQDTLAGIGAKINGLQPQGGSAPQGGCRGPLSLLGVVAKDMPSGVHSLPDDHPYRLAWDKAKARAKPLVVRLDQLEKELTRLQWAPLMAGGTSPPTPKEEADLRAYLAAEAEAAQVRNQLAPIEMETARYQDAAQKLCKG